MASSLISLIAIYFQRHGHCLASMVAQYRPMMPMAVTLVGLAVTSMNSPMRMVAASAAVAVAAVAHALHALFDTSTMFVHSFVLVDSWPMLRYWSIVLPSVSPLTPMSLNILVRSYAAHSTVAAPVLDAVALTVSFHSYEPI